LLIFYHRAKETIQRLTLENSRLYEDNKNLNKQIDNSTHLSEVKEEMAAYYYSTEIEELNKNIKNLINRNVALYNALQQRGELIRKISEILLELAGNPTPDLSTPIDQSPKKEISENKEAGDNQSSNINEIKDTTEEYLEIIRKSLEKITNRQLELTEKLIKIETEKPKKPHIENPKQNLYNDTRSRIGSFGLIYAKAEKSEDNILQGISERLTQGLPIEQMPTLWIPDDFTNRCQICNIGFGCLFSRKTHCHMCGGLVCTKCCTKKKFVPPFYTIQKVQICDYCVEIRDKENNAKFLFS